MTEENSPEVVAEATPEVIVEKKPKKAPKAKAEVVVEPEPVVEPETPKKRRGKVPTKAQIHSVEDVVAFVRREKSDDAVIKRLREVFASKFAEQKDLIIDSMWPDISASSSKKQEWYSDHVISKIRNARKPKF